jgi:hypothetical protein
MVGHLANAMLASLLESTSVVPARSTMLDRISSIALHRQGLDATRTSPPPVEGRKMSLDIPFHLNPA